MSAPNHFAYECSVFSYTAYPTVVIEIDCFREDGTQSNCYKYSFTWATAEDYQDWLVVASSLSLSGTTAKRLTGMFDALNQFLRIGPLTFNGTRRGTWLRTAKFAGPCPLNLAAYQAFEQTSGDFIDSANTQHMPRNAATSVPGIISEGVSLGGSAITLAEPNVIAWDASVNPGWTIWGWFNVTASSGLIALRWGFGTFFLHTYIGLRQPTGTSWITVIEVNFANYFTPATITPGTWHLLVGTADNTTGAVRLYLDNVMITTATASTPVLSTDTYRFEIDLSNPNGTNLFDESGINTSVAASPAQVANLWNGGGGLTWPAVAGAF